MELTVSSLLVASPDQISCEYNGQAVILNVAAGVYYGLNGSGTSAWNKLQQPIRFEALLNGLVEEYEVEPGRCSQDLIQLITALKNAGLIIVRDADDSPAA